MDTPFFAIHPITHFIHSTSDMFHNRETCRFNIPVRNASTLIRYLVKSFPTSVSQSWWLCNQSSVHHLGTKIDFTRGMFFLSCFISDYFFAESSPAVAAQLIADSCSFLREMLTWIRKALAIYHWHDNIPHIYHKFAGKSACQTFV